MTFDEMSSEKPVTPKRLNAEFDDKSETMRDVEEDPRVEGKKTKKKEAKKDKNKRENVQSRNLAGLFVCGLSRAFHHNLLFSRDRTE